MASTESTLRPAPPAMRVLVTATRQMVGVHSIGSAPEHMGLKGWSSESKVRSASGATQPGGASRHLEAVLIRRVNGLTWWLEGGAGEPPQESRDDGRRWRGKTGEEEVAQLLPGGDRGRRQVEEPRARDAGEGHR